MYRIISVAVFAIFIPSNAIFAAARTDPSSPPENQLGSFTGGLSSSLLIFIFSLATAVIFIGLVSAYIICNQRRAGTSSYPPLRVLQPLPATAARGVDASVVETFPAFVYAEVKSMKIGKGALECAVCLNEFEDHEALRLLPKCDHVFHTRCIGAWLGSHTTCPVCRSDLAAEPIVERIIQTEASRVESQTEGERYEPAVQIEPNQDNEDYTRGTALAVTSVRLLRWNSTGHSSVRTGENTDRFTLKLLEDVRKQIVMTPSQSVVVEKNTKSERTLNRWQTMSDRWLSHNTSSFH